MNTGNEQQAANVSNVAEFGENYFANSGDSQSSNSGNNQSDQKQNPNKPDKPPLLDPSKPLPDDPSKLGPDWKKNPDYKNPNGEEYVNVKTGEKLEWNKGRKGPWPDSADRGKDGWHYTPPGGVRGKQTDPGKTLKYLRDLNDKALKFVERCWFCLMPL